MIRSLHIQKTVLSPHGRKEAAPADDLSPFYIYLQRVSTCFNHPRLQGSKDFPHELCILARPPRNLASRPQIRHDATGSPGSASLWRTFSRTEDPHPCNGWINSESILMGESTMGESTNHISMAMASANCEITRGFFWCFPRVVPFRSANGQACYECSWWRHGGFRKGEMPHWWHRSFIWGLYSATVTNIQIAVGSKLFLWTRIVIVHTVIFWLLAVAIQMLLVIYILVKSRNSFWSGCGSNLKNHKIASLRLKTGTCLFLPQSFFLKEDM